MKIADFSIRRPLTIAVVVFIILIMGAVSLSRLSIDLYPEMDLPVAAVITEYQGAGPQEVENLVTRPLEGVLGTVNSLDSIQSVSSMGNSMVIVMFNWGTDMDFATLQMREKVDLIRGFLPDGVGTPSVFKMDPNMMPILQLAVTGNDAARVKQLTDDVIEPAISRVPGVATVYYTGAVEREIQVLVDPARLQGYGLSLNHISGALLAENMNVSGGQVQDGKKDLLVRATGEYKSLEDIRRVVLSVPGGPTVYLGEVAEVRDGYKDQAQLSRVDGEPGLSLHVQKQSGANTVQVAGDVKKQMAQLEDQLPSDVKFSIILDQSVFIEDSINSVVKKTLAGGLLAVLVLLVFMRNMRSTLIISTAIPISIISTFVLLYFNNMTLNLMSLGGLALGIGLIVDDAIVVLENIYRHRQNGYGLIEAAGAGTAEVASPVITSTLTIIAVFLPIVFVEGIAAQLFGPMALTVAFAVAASLVVALTLVPMLASRYLKLEQPQQDKGLGKVFQKSENWYNNLLRAYRRLLAWSLGRRKLVLMVVGVLFAISVALTPLVGMEFLPGMDEGYVQVSVKLPNGAMLEETNRYAGMIEDIGRDIPEVKSIITNVGSGGDMGGMGGAQTELAQVYFELVNKGERAKSDKELAALVTAKVKDIPGADIDVQAAGPGMEGGMGGSPLQITIKGHDLDTLAQLARQAEEIVRQVPGTTQVASDLAEGRPEVRVIVDRDRAAAYGLSISDVAATVRTAIQGSVATRYRTGGEEIDVRLRLAGGSEARLGDLRELIITSNTGMQVPLRQIASLEEAEGPNSITRIDQSRTVSITSNIAGRDLGSVSADVQQALQALPLPPGYEISYGGETEEMIEAFGSLLLALILAIILVYLVMVAQFESLLYPFIIMFSLPVTLIGVVFSLLITGWSFSVTAFIGLILLAGIVVKNAIVLVDYINVLRNRGMERDEAILEAGPIRLRPILMTALTAILAMIPLATGIGEGSEGQAPMAVVVVGGLTFSTLITLVLVPVVYTIMDDLVNKFKARFVR
jgi:HAE1 family hydrophobic/amphiphilic exporter-1